MTSDLSVESWYPLLSSNVVNPAAPYVMIHGIQEECSDSSDEEPPSHIPTTGASSKRRRAATTTSNTSQQHVFSQFSKALRDLAPLVEQLSTKVETDEQVSKLVADLASAREQIDLLSNDRQRVTHLEEELVERDQLLLDLQSEVETMRSRLTHLEQVERDHLIIRQGMAEMYERYATKKSKVGD